MEQIKQLLLVTDKDAALFAKLRASSNSIFSEIAVAKVLNSSPAPTVSITFSLSLKEGILQVINISCTQNAFFTQVIIDVPTPNSQIF